MRKILQLFFGLSLALALLPNSVRAQEKIVTGTVTSEDKTTALRGVTIRVKGTRKITQTDVNGQFKISVVNNDVLVFTYVGYHPVEVAVGNDNTITITLKPSDNTMGEVVVTALDIRRNARSLGYSAQKVGGAEIAGTQRENFINSLAGRVAGLTINPSTGQAGASSQIILRGFNSFSLNNQPIIVLDGVIIDNQTINETSNGGSGIGLASDLPNRNNDYTNRAADINPQDIESITVLKGPEAAALYGSQAAGGAILITTKKATPGKIGFAYDNSFRISEVTRYAKTNNVYGPGTNGVPGNVLNSAPGSYFGPKYPALTTRYDNIGNFFNTGFAQTHNISADVGIKNVGFKITGSYFDEDGVTPNNAFKKYNVRLSNTTKIGKIIDFTPSIQYIYSTNDKPLRSAGGYLLNLYVWPVNNDIRNYQDIDGNKISFAAINPGTELDNPLYNVNRNQSYDQTKRWIISGGLNINPFSWLSISGRFGYDTYKTSGFTFYHPLSNLAASTRGRLDNYWREFTGYNHTITATAKKTVGKWSGSIMGGTMWQDNQTDMWSISGTGVIDSIGSTTGKMYKKVNGVMTYVTDATFEDIVGKKTDSSITAVNTRLRLLRNAFGLPNQLITRQLAYFGEATLSYNNLLFLDYTHRFEHASVFPKAHRNFDYPGFSVSAIVSDIFPGMKGKIINFLKLRASRASTARYPDPYKNQSVFVNNFTSSNVGLIYSYGFDNNNINLEPERQNTYEIGTEMRLLNNSLTLDFAYYNTKCIKQIVNQFRASYATGFILNTQNAASLINHGVEAVVNLSAIRKKDLTWNTSLNFNRGWSKVLSLPEAILTEYYIADTWLYGNARGGLFRNQPTTTITGFHYLRNNAGQIIISPTTGLPMVDGTFSVIGDRAPLFTLGWNNQIRYKNWSLSFLWDLKWGGDVFDGTDMYLTLQGKSARTADRETPRIIKGVLNDGLQNTSNPTTNTIVVIPYFNQSYYTGMPEEEFIEHHVNWFRLRDATLSYTLPARALKSMRIFKSLSIFATGTDLVLLTNYRGADPGVNGNTASGLGIGAFAFDYGSLPTPTAVNFGIKATFK